MSAPIPVGGPSVPLAYVAERPRRGDSVVGIIAFGLAIVCALLPAFMLYQLLRGQRHHWGVYTPYAANIGVLNAGGNVPWYALDTLAILGGGAGLQRGRARFGAAAVAIATLAMAAVLTIVLGSPW